MKFLIVFALVLGTAFAFDLRGNHIESRSVDVPISAAEGRITNGENAADGQFPYQVCLSLVMSATEAFWCGGSLISNEWVLTAGHCTKGIQSVTVYLGATKRNSPDSGGPLVLESSKILVGVTSFVLKKGCELGAPAGFARVTHYLDWIKDCSGISY